MQFTIVLHILFLSKGSDLILQSSSLSCIVQQTTGPTITATATTTTTTATTISNRRQKKERETKMSKGNYKTCFIFIFTIL